MRLKYQKPYVYFVLFAISGFTGLIYESIWSHYLQLLLGHAAYAQTLVLGIFMGGMAIGSWLPRYARFRRKDVLLGYAVVEGVIGFCAIAFHGSFVYLTDLAYGVVLPALGSDWSVGVFKWALGSALILPQSILLGMTFPLMCAGVIRRHPENPGETIAMLYFTNSFGAAIGVLVSGFILIGWVGLPGTILTAGLLNVMLALVVWLIARSAGTRETPAQTATKDAGPDDMWRLLVMVSMLTGATSFVYEIGWIRMLSLVLGTSTHAFELMLSAFITGLALGGLWVRRRIDRLVNSTSFLGWVQVAMGLLALGTIVAYNFTFGAISLLMEGLARTESGYYLFGVASHGLALLIMVPVTFFAGMTLPLITHALFVRGHGEKSIGTVYAANTLGGIAGVFFAVHVGMPILGLKGIIAIGAAVDIALGVVLLRVACGSTSRRHIWAAALGAATVAAILLGARFDGYKMASGVYRHGHLYAPGTIRILFHEDGKTATVDLLGDSSGSVSIVTNGKPDAKINMSANGSATPDEATMILAAAVPMAIHPGARSIANIGMGSGLTTHVLLGNANIERVDTIEIEPAMIEAARGFHPRNSRAYEDSRSRFHVDDAKAFFAARRSHYDIVVSEPSNPWVTGVSGLFTNEFYTRIRAHLHDDGLFVQWIQLYEIDFDLVATIIKAVGQNFSDYALFATDDTNLLIVARKTGSVPPVGGTVFNQPQVAESLHRIGVRSVDDLGLRHIGNRATIGPLFEAANVPANSDYFPVLDLNAARSRFLGSRSDDILALNSAGLPALEMLGAGNSRLAIGRPTVAGYYTESRRAANARVLHEHLVRDAQDDLVGLDPALARHAALIRAFHKNCAGTSSTALWIDSVGEVMTAATPFLSVAQATALYQRINLSDCHGRLSNPQREFLALLGAVARRDAEKMARHAEMILANRWLPVHTDYILSAAVLGELALGERQVAAALFRKHARELVSGPDGPGTLLRLLWASANR